MRRALGIADLGLLEAMFGALPDCPFFVKDKSLRYVAANPAMARLCGVKRAGDLYGRNANDFFPMALARRYEALDRQVLASGRPVTNQLDLTLAHKVEPVWLLFSRVPISDANGELIGVAAASQKLKPVDKAHPTYKRLAVIVQRIESRFAEPLNLKSLSALAGVSSSQIERDFTQLFGMTLRAFLHKTRLDHALELLEAGHSIADIAYACGYADHSAFSRRFKALMGMSPRDYRAELRRGV